MPRGGPRPGAGAPAGNLNALESGAYSPRFLPGLLLLGLVRDARPIYAALKRKDARQYRRLLFQTIDAAYRAAQHDPGLARAINDLIADRIQQAHHTAQEKRNTIRQSNAGPAP